MQCIPGRCPEFRGRPGLEAKVDVTNKNVQGLLPNYITGFYHRLKRKGIGNENVCVKHSAL